MNFIASNRILNPLMTLVYVATIVVITALSIQLLYGVFRIIQMFIEDPSSQTGQYFTQLVKAIN